MEFKASDFYPYHRPSQCDLRVWLQHQGVPEPGPSPFQETLFRLGERHERAHLATLAGCVDLSQGSFEERVAKTRDTVEAGAAAIYQPAFAATAAIDGRECRVVGVPDFLIAVPAGGYVIRDSKLSRRINAKDHPEILLQLGLYGWLYERALDRAPAGLEVHSGAGDIVELEYDGGEKALATLAEILAVRDLPEPPYAAVGLSKCGGCGYHDRCWPAAEERHDVALVYEVDKGLVTELRGRGVESYEQLIERFGADSDGFADVERPWGKRMQRVGGRAERILEGSRALADQRQIVLATPAIPEHPSYVMFDLEGMPPQFDELEKVYLWGAQVFGDEPGEFQAALAGFGPEGDRQGWERFLEIAAGVIERHDDIPWVHWASYEKTKLKLYVDRFGDPEGVAARVIANLLDLLPVVRNAVVLPLPGYGLKLVERYVGYERTQEEVGGDWAMAKYIEATETEDEALRDEFMGQVSRYNREDLEAMWAVFEWARALSA